MKNIKCLSILFLFAVSVGLQAQTNTNNIIEAARKGKADLIKITAENKEFNFGISAKDLENSKETSPITEYTADFNSLVSGNISNINSIIKSYGMYVVPFANNASVITTVGVFVDEKGAKVTEFINHQYTSELNELPREVKATNFKGVKIVTVPNLNAVLYLTEDNKCYTGYNGRNVKEAANISELLNQLEREAKEFQTEYGDQLKSKKLVR